MMLYVWLLTVLCCLRHCLGGEDISIACSVVKYVYIENGFDDDDVPKQAINGNHLSICESSMTCCTTEMEDKLASHSQNEFNEHLKETVSQLRSVFVTYTNKFDEFFKELMKTSRKDFHEMFLKTYGMLYETNSYIFKSMFDDLEKYYLTGSINLVDALENFFQHLYKKMYQVINGQYRFGEGHLNCIADYMDEMKPFGDVPKKLTLEVKRSFVATRTFVQALAIGRDVVKNILEVVPAANCDRSLMKMTYCPHCRGLPELKPCEDYCRNVIKGCLKQHIKLESEWNDYIDALFLLGSRLESSFNIESVINPINIKISDAIMNFQENGHAVSQKLFEKCGKPRLEKRSANQELTFETLKFSYKQNGGVRPTTAAGTSLDRLIQSIRKRLKRTKGYWMRLPQTMCGNEKMKRSHLKENSNCWNGLEQEKYEGTTVDESNNTLTTQESNDSTDLNSFVNQQLLTLKLISTKLSDAYNGLDVEWPDSMDSDWISSGSGSGSGYDALASEPTEGFGDIYFSVSTPIAATEAAPANPTSDIKSVAQSISYRPLVLVLCILCASLW